MVPEVVVSFLGRAQPFRHPVSSSVADPRTDLARPGKSVTSSSRRGWG